jgi:hypothetical protein
LRSLVSPLPQAVCGRHIHHSGWEKQQGKSAAIMRTGDAGQLAGVEPFLCTRQNAATKTVALDSDRFAADGRLLGNWKCLGETK